MSSSTALLPKNAKKDDHPIFLRACHSPWVSVSQKFLVTARGFVTAYMTVLFMMIIYYDIEKVKHGWLTLFDFSNIVYLLQVVYSWTTFVWTYMHLHYPHHGSLAPSHASRLQKFLSPPRQHQTTKNRVFFSIFYTAAVAFPHVVTLTYWLILNPHNQTTREDLLGHGWFKAFVLLNKHSINTLIGLIEVLVFSSIKRQEPIWAHVIGLTTLSLIYVGWVYIGKMVTGDYVYYFFDLQELGWEYIMCVITSLCGMSNTFFAVVYGFTGLREALTKKSEDKTVGYTRLPQ